MQDFKILGHINLLLTLDLTSLDRLGMVMVQLSGLIRGSQVEVYPISFIQAYSSQVSNQTLGSADTSISNLIDNGAWVRKINIPDHKQNCIQRTSNPGGSDKWVWMENTSKSFSFKSTWQVCRTIYLHFQFRNLIWYSKICPKMVYYLYKAVHNKLLTRDRLHKFGIIRNCSCPVQPRCGNLVSSIF